MPTQVTPPLETVSTNDHDLLIEVNTNVKNLTATLHTYTSSAKQTMTDHETRLRGVEKELTDTRAELKGSRRTTNLFLAILTIAVAIIGVVAAFAQIGR